MSRLHRLKTWPAPFQAVLDGRKSFEFRKDDRAYAVGDVLSLSEYDPDAEKHTGREAQVVVAYILHGGKHGLPIGYVVMSVRALS